jgi:CheY-like chemotaxis protein
VKCSKERHVGAQESTLPRLLVIDDDIAVLGAVCALLELEGIDVTAANSGYVGIEAVETQTFDAIIVDIFMPGMDGLETIKSLRRRAPGVPIIAVSGFMSRSRYASTPDVLGMATTLGATSALAKPFTPRDLMLAIDGCLLPQPRIPLNEVIRVSASACTPYYRRSSMETSLVRKRSIVISGHKTSVSLEDPFWDGLKEIAHERPATLSFLVDEIDSSRENGNLSSAIRLFVLEHYRAMPLAAGTA